MPAANFGGMPGASTLSDSDSKTTPGDPTDAQDSLRVLRRTLWIAGIATLSAVVAYTVFRATTARRGDQDPTSERIQGLIDEANRLLRTLDDKKRP